MRGLVIKNTGSWYTVKTDDGQLIEFQIEGHPQHQSCGCR